MTALWWRTECCEKIFTKNKERWRFEADLLFISITIINMNGKGADLKIPKGKTNWKKMNIDHLRKYVEIQPWIPAKWIASVLRFPSDPQSPTFTLRPQSDPVFLSLQSCNTTSFKSPISVSIDVITVKFQRQHTERHLHTSRSYASIGLGWPFEKWWCIQLLIRPW